MTVVPDGRTELSSSQSDVKCFAPNASKTRFRSVSPIRSISRKKMTSEKCLKNHYLKHPFLTKA